MPAKRKRVGRPGYKARILAYKSENRATKNKEKKLARHMRKHPNDMQSLERRIPVSYLSAADKMRIQNVRKNVKKTYK